MSKLNTVSKHDYKGRLFQSVSCGKFIILNYIGWDKVLICFTNSRYKSVVQMTHVRSGSVKDPTAVSVCGIGYIGEGVYTPSINRVLTKPYQVWVDMLKRCYDIKTQQKQPTYVGCTVCTEWHSFQNFAAWFELNYIPNYHIDKDIILSGNKVYSPKTCVFVSQKINNIKAHAKYYTFVDPNGEIRIVYNLSDFCRKNGLSQPSMSLVHTGNLDHHQDWRKL